MSRIFQKRFKRQKNKGELDIGGAKHNHNF